MDRMLFLFLTAKCNNNVITSSADAGTPPVASACQQPRFVGTTDGCSTPTPGTRWYYHAEPRKCQEFKYKGCDGNANNFDTKAICETACP